VINDGTSTVVKTWITKLPSIICDKLLCRKNNLVVDADASGDATAVNLFTDTTGVQVSMQTTTITIRQW